jgi:AraC family L-rhamnose operon regulatory protein RhaS
VISPAARETLQLWQHAGSQAGMERETWEGRNRLLSELPIFGWLRFGSALRGALRPDRHPHEFEIHYLKRGRLNWWVTETSYEFLPGSVFIVPPNALHGGDEECLQPCEHLWLRLNLDRGPLPGLSAAQSSEIRKGFHALTHTTFPVSTTVAAHFDALLQEHRDKTRLGTIMARGLLHALLASILRDYDVFTSRARSTPLVTWRIRRVLEMLDADVHANHRIADLARNVGLSESGFRERFKTEMGFSPHEYILNQRITAARKQLEETDHDITRIALDFGFSSSQYFATAFRRLVGLAPGDYRRRHRNA